MDLHHKLASWLYSADRDYPEGLELLGKLGINSDPFFEVASPTKLHYSLLFRSLAGYGRRMNISPGVPSVVEKLKPVPESVPNPEQIPDKLFSGNIQRPKIDRNPSVRYEDLPVHLQVLFDANARMQAEMKSLHARLKSLKDDASATKERSALVSELVSRQTTIRRNWDEIDAWWAARNENLETLEEKAAREALEKDRRIKANLNYIRRYFGKEKYQAEVSLRMEELDKWNISYERLIS